MHVLITGAAGFLGSHLCEKFLQDGHWVHGVDDLSSGQFTHIKYLEKTYPHFTWDIQNVVNDDVSYPQVEGILHLASAASPPDYMKRPFATIEANVDGTRNLLRWADEWHARFLYTSTSEIYGDPLVHPQTEEYWGNVSSIGPRSVYDEAKRMGETLVMAYHRYHGVDTRLVRLFNTYGPRMRKTDGRVVTNFINQALDNQDLTVYGSGQQTRSLCYVDDTIDGIYRAFWNGNAYPVNIGNPEEYTVLDIARIILELIPESTSRLVYKDAVVHDPKQRCPDITNAVELLGWTPHIFARDGLHKTIEFFRTL